MAETATPSSIRSDIGHNDIAGTAGKSAWGAGLLKNSFAELFGTFMLMLVGLGVYLAALIQGGDRMWASLAFGFTFIVVLALFGSASSGYFNPALTLASAIAGRVGWLPAAVYIVMQVIGALFAGLVLFIVVNASPLLATNVTQAFTQLGNSFGETSQLQVPMLSAGLIELIATAVLAAVVLAAFRPGAERSGLSRVGGAVAVGLSYFGLLSFLVPFTNAGLNPARSMATLPWGDPTLWGQLWLFWVAPLAGAVLAGLVYRGFFALEGDAATHGPVVADVEETEIAIDAPADPELSTQEAPVSADKQASTTLEETTVDTETKDFFDKK